jgi:hypothetical protein
MFFITVMRSFIQRSPIISINRTGGFPKIFFRQCSNQDI